MIFHADGNSFYASCEQIFRPDLRGKPVAVLSNNDGIIIALNKEAKALGIKRGDPYFKVRDLCIMRHITIFSSNYTLYEDISRRITSIYMEYAPDIEEYSIDEAFLDLTGMEADFNALAKTISRECRRLTAIPVSVGISPTKTLAKIASKLCKKYPKLQGGCYMWRPQDIEKVLRTFPVEDVWGIGRRSFKKLADMGVKTAWDYTQLQETTVRKLFNLPGFRTWKELRGIPCIEFEDMIEPKQSICISRSFAHEVTTLQEFTEQIATFASRATAKLRAQNTLATEMAVFAMTNRFKEDLPQTSGGLYTVFPDGAADYRTIVTSAIKTARSLFRPGFGYKKAGVVFTKIIPAEGASASIWADTDAQERDENLSKVLDSIHKSFGNGALLWGAQGDGQFHMAQEHRSPHYTTLWSDIPKVTVK